MNARIILIPLFVLFFACQSDSSTKQSWIDSQIKLYLAESNHPVSTLYDENHNVHDWNQIENIVIGNNEYLQYELRLSAKENDESPGHVIVTTNIALDPQNKSIYEMEFESGEFKKYK